MMAISYRTKDRLFRMLVIILLGAPIAFWLFLVMNLRRQRVSLAEEISNQLGLTQSYLDQPDKLPRKKLVEAYRGYQESLLAEYGNLAKYFLQHDKMLERHILHGDQADEIQIVLNYTNDLKPNWAKKVGNPDFLKNWEWERADGRLQLSMFPAVEKWCCMVDTVVDGLTAEGYVKVDTLKVGKPFTPPGVAKAPKVAWPVLRYEAVPVIVEFSASFRNLPRILKRFVQRPDDIACTEIVRLELSTRTAKGTTEGAPTPEGWVDVTMEIWIYDFSWVGG